MIQSLYFIERFIMGTRACTRIQSKDDYIEMATRWDGFPDEIKEHLTNLINEWESTHAILKSKNSVMLGNAYANWIDDLGALIADAKVNPTIEKLTVLFCAKSFTHHHVMPCSKQENSLKYWGAGFPNVVASINNYKEVVDASSNNSNEVSYTSLLFDKEPIHINVASKDIEDEYSIVRIVDIQDNEYYVDIKVKNYEHQEFLNKVLSINQLWRNIHYSTQVEMASDDITSILWSYNSTIERFYSNVCHLEKDSESYNKALQKSISSVNRMIPFDMSINSLATHFCIVQPGKAFPLTVAQQNHQEQPVAIIKIINSRLSDFSIDFTGLNQEQKIELMNEAYTYLLDEEYDFEEINGVEADHGHIGIGVIAEDQNIVVKENDELYFAYENNLCHYLTSTIGVLPPVIKEE